MKEVAAGALLERVHQESALRVSCERDALNGLEVLARFLFSPCTRARVERLQTDPAWKDNVLFNEYFHGDNGAGLGASHQTGWTGLVAELILRSRGVPLPTLGELMTTHWTAGRT